MMSQHIEDVPTGEMAGAAALFSRLRLAAARPHLDDCQLT